MSIPFAVASLGRGLGLVLTGMAERRPGRWLSSARMMSLVVLLALVAGTPRWTNSWDHPPLLLPGHRRAAHRRAHFRGPPELADGLPWGVRRRRAGGPFHRHVLPFPAGLSAVPGRPPR